MKRVLLLFFAVFATAFSASAYDFEVDGIYYNAISPTELTCEVTFKDNNFDSYSGDVIIPRTVTYGGMTFTVKAIGYHAFDRCRGLTSVLIPNSVVSIGSFAFYWCSDLTEIVIPNSITSIGDCAFSGCISLTSVVCKAVTPPNANNSFNNSHYNSATLTVPTRSMNTYIVTSPWSKFKMIKGGAEDM